MWGSLSGLLKPKFLCMTMLRSMIITITIDLSIVIHKNFGFNTMGLHGVICGLVQDSKQKCRNNIKSVKIKLNLWESPEIVGPKSKASD